MNEYQYQKNAARTLIKEPREWPNGHEMMMVWCALGLTGEAGEVADIVKKGALHRHGIDDAALFEELGDVLWYVSSLCTLKDWDIAAVMDANIDKLKRRYPNGWTAKDSVRRIDHA